MTKISAADKMQIKLMSELKESKYTFKQLKKFWNEYEIDPNKKQKKSDKILDNLFDLACKKNPAEMGMVGFEFKDEEQMMTAINKKNLTLEGIPKKNKKQTGGMNYYKLFNKIISEPCIGPHCTIPVKPEVSNMINNNLKSANPPPEALTQYPGTDRIGNNSMQMSGVSNYVGTTLNHGPFNIKCTGQKAGADINEIDIEVLNTKPTFDSVYNNNKYKDKVFHIDREKADELMTLNSHYEDIFLQDNNNLKLLVEYITEGIDNTELGFDDSNNFYFKSVVQEFIEYWDEFDPCYHNLVPDLEYYFDLLIKEKILVEFEPFMPNGGGFNDLYSGDNQGTFFSQQKPFKTIGGGFTGISSGDNQGTFYSNIRCPKSGISYNISSTMGINILKNYLTTLKGGSPWITDQSSRSFEIMEKILEEILHKCNNDNDKKILYQDIKSISESTDLDDKLYEYCIEKFMDELVDYNLRFDGDLRLVIQEHNNFEIYQKIKKNLESLTGGSGSEEGEGKKFSKEEDAKILDMFDKAMSLPQADTVATSIEVKFLGQGLCRVYDIKPTDSLKDILFKYADMRDMKITQNHIDKGLFRLLNPVKGGGSWPLYNDDMTMAELRPLPGWALLFTLRV